MKTSEQINELCAALSKAQGEFKNPERNRDVEVTTKKGDKYTFAYMTFDAVLDMARPILTAHGLSFTQLPETHDGNVHVTTRLMHASGQWLEGTLGVGLGAEAGPQQIGSCITYLKRYSITSMLGIAAEEDDDGNAAGGNVATAKARETLPPCPKCGKTSSVIRGKEEYGGGLVCFTKKEGCGHKWQEKPDAPPSGNEKAKDEPDNRSPAEKAHAFIRAADSHAKLLPIVNKIIAHKELHDAEKEVLLDRCSQRATELPEAEEGGRAALLTVIHSGLATVDSA